LVLEVDWRKQLFLDHRLMEASEGVRLVVNGAVKHGKPVLVADKPWENATLGGYITVLREEDLFRLWYEAYASDCMSDFDARLCYAESHDGLTWTKPELGLFEFQGSKKDNIVFEDRAGDGYHGGTVFKDPSAPAAERFKVLYQARGGTRPEQWNACMRGIYSADGIHWSKYPGILADHLSDTQSVVDYDEASGRYVGYFRLWVKEKVRAIGRSETGDFRSWPRDSFLVLAPDELDAPDMSMYTNAYHRYRDAQDAHLFFISCFYTSTNCLDVQLATSRDGKLWHRPSREPFLRLGPDEAWDSKMFFVGVSVLPVGEELWLYYSAHSHDHGKSLEQVRCGGGIGLARVRMDGFTSIDAGPGGGSFTTPLIRFSGRRLELNYDAGAGGALTVGLFDEEGCAIEGFSNPECDPLRGNHLAKTVSWKGRSDLGALAGRAVRLSFTLRNAKLYGFQFPVHEGLAVSPQGGFAG